MDYLNIEEVESAILNLHSAYPAITKLITLPNKTFEGRICHALQLGSSSSQNSDCVMITGGVHAREWGSCEILINFITDLLEAYTGKTGLGYGGKTFTSQQVQDLITKLQIVVFPLVNPDGRKYSQETADWRKNRNPVGSNCIGVDINRNFDFLWHFETAFSKSCPAEMWGLASSDPCDDEIYHGPSPFSEQETQNVRWLLDTYPNTRWFIDVHSCSELILYNWGDDENQSADPAMNFQNSAYDGLRGCKGDSYKEFIPSNDHYVAKTLSWYMQDAILAVRGKNYAAKQSHELYPTSGTSDDYAYSRHFVDPAKGKVYGFTIEWSPYPIFQPPYQEMELIVLDITAGLIQFCLVAPTITDKPPVLYFGGNKTSFGRDEVTDNLSPPNNGMYYKPIWLFLEGVSIGALNNKKPDMSGPVFGTNGIADIQILPSQPVPDYEIPGDLTTPQRISYTYNIIFTQKSLNSFPKNDQCSVFELDASIEIQGIQLKAAILLEFTAGANPYFSNVDPDQHNAYYLSQDLRVFTATPQLNKIPVFKGPEFTDVSINGAYAYLQDLLKYLNGQYWDPGKTDPFKASNNILPVASTGDSSVTPFTSSGSSGILPNFNFALARVRLQGTADKAENVKVFFRVWGTQTADTDFLPSSTYPSHKNSVNKPDWPLSAIDVHTFPCFATGIAPDFNNPNNPEYGANGINNRSILINQGNKSCWTYFGCFLNFYDPNNIIQGKNVQQWLTGTHHCIVAEIAYDKAPVPTVLSSIGPVSPENCDKLAQRNLQVTHSDNPGSLATHRIPQTFDLRPSPPFIPGATGLLNYPDELMFDWGNTPVGSIASIYWPQIDAAQVLNLAAGLYTTHLLSSPDKNTIQCTVTRGITYIPVPLGGNQNIAALLTVDLPSDVVKGQEFNIVVRRITTRRRETDIPGFSVKEGMVSSTAKNEAQEPIPAGSESGLISGINRNELNWRYVVGTFQVKIPVSTRDTILHPEEDTLAILKWRLQEMSPSDRWYPVLKRYITYISERVDGLGGDSDSVGPSISGHHMTQKPPCRILSLCSVILLGTAIVAFGLLNTLQALLSAAVFTGVYYLLLKKCKPKRCFQVKTIFAGACLGVIILFLFIFMGVSAPVLMFVLMGALVLTGIAGVYGIIHHCFSP